MSPCTLGMTGENRGVCPRDGRREQRSCAQLWMLERIHAPLFPTPASLFFCLSVILFFCHSERSEESFPHTGKPILRSLRSLRMTRRWTKLPQDDRGIKFSQDDRNGPHEKHVRNPLLPLARSQWELHVLIQQFPKIRQLSAKKEAGCTKPYIPPLFSFRLFLPVRQFHINRAMPRVLHKTQQIFPAEFQRGGAEPRMSADKRILD